MLKKSNKKREDKNSSHSKTLQKTGMLSGINLRFHIFLENHLLVILLTLCFLALLRIFLFSAIFPFFNNVDEQAHYDTVIKYSHGYLPREGNNKYEPSAVENILLYGSPEYFHGPADFPDKEIPPPPYLYRSQILPLITEQLNNLAKIKNPEAFSPPVYYTLAGMWCDLGKLMGIGGGYLIYWIRFLNIFIYAALFWVTYFLCRKIFPDNLSIQLGVLLLLAFFPQDVFYSISNDVLSPLFCLTSLYLLLEIYNSQKSPQFHFLTGIIISATILVKYTNIPIFLIFIALMARKIANLLKNREIKNQLMNIALLAAGSVLPIICWFCWNVYALGDITGNAEKISDLGWTVKSFVDMWNHPIFTFKGLTLFGSEILKSFWRGEFTWGMKPIASSWADYFYIISSGIFIITSIINSIVSKTDYSANQRLLNNASTFILLLFILFLASFSIMYDFGTCFYPSRENPFLASGRLIIGGLIPFLILYIDGLRILLSKISKRVDLLLAIVLLICILITYSEIDITYPVAKSAYNWFHLH
jgi:hypothetical protein